MRAHGHVVEVAPAAAGSGWSVEGIGACGGEKMGLFRLVVHDDDGAVGGGQTDELVLGHGPAPGEELGLGIDEPLVEDKLVDLMATPASGGRS